MSRRAREAVRLAIDFAITGIAIVVALYLPAQIAEFIGRWAIFLVATTAVTLGMKRRGY